jgi:hypothetical protein
LYCFEEIINPPRYLWDIVGGVNEKRFAGVFYERLHEHFSAPLSGTFPQPPGNERQGDYALGLCCFFTSNAQRYEDYLKESKTRVKYHRCKG